MQSSGGASFRLSTVQLLAAVGCWVLILIAAPVKAQDELQVIAVSPAPSSVGARAATKISIEFDRPVLRSSVNTRSFWAFGRWSGAAKGKIIFSNGSRTASLEASRAFSAGESVMVLLSRDIQAQDGSSLRAGGYSFQFWVRSQGGGGKVLEEAARFSTRTTQEATTRAYGGFGSDLDGDGFLDLTVVNEDTSDLRVFLNRGEGGGLETSYLDPPTATGSVPSPSEPSDFNRDGNVDVVVANTQGSSLSVFLGNGDGTFGPAQTLTVGGEPRGVTVLDADGDADVDIVTSTFADGRVTVFFNDGSGAFGDPKSFGTGGGEWAIAAGDMNRDGRLDLVVGARTAQEIHIYLAGEAGEFSRSVTRTSGGLTWMLVVGDVDGDGDEDVAAVNGDSDNGAILLGDGAGGLTAPKVYATDRFPLATDLGDLDGDDDLDWVTSSFFGDWMLFENRGGEFVHRESFAAPQAASCSIPMDIDNDGALDLVLIDELEDEVIVMMSSGAGFASDFEGGSTDDWSRTKGAPTVVSPGLAGSLHALEIPLGARAYVESREPRKEPSWSTHVTLDVSGVELRGGEVEFLRLMAKRVRARLVLEESAGGLRVRLEARNAGQLEAIGSVKVSAKGVVEIGVEWAAATVEGEPGAVALLKDGRVRVETLELDNVGERITKVRLGLPEGSSGGATGSLLFDNYRSSSR